MSANNRRGGRAAHRGGTSGPSRGGGNSWRSGAGASTSIVHPGEPQYVSKKFTASGSIKSDDSGQGRGRGGRGGGRLRTPGPSRMDLMASVSRSSGLEKGGDDLKNFKIQEEYREFVHEKFGQLVKRHYPRRFVHENKREQEHRIEEQENVLILFRKLREGVMASKRADGFALEVYETSLYLAIVFESPKQPPSIIPHLIPGVYQSSSSLQPLRLTTLIVSLVYHLATTYPSQTTFRKHLDSIPTALLPRDSKACRWICDLAHSLRTKNYTQFDRLSRISKLSSVLEEPVGGLLTIESLTKATRGDSSRELSHNAILTSLHALRTKARDTFWNVVRSAYNELACTPTAGDSKQWLTRSLCLESPLSEDLTQDPEAWLDEQVQVGIILAKEGVKGRYLCKFRR